MIGRKKAVEAYGGTDAEKAVDAGLGRVRFIKEGNGLPGWITVHRKGAENTIAVGQIRNIFPYQIVTEDGATLTRIAFQNGMALDIDETIGEVRRRIWDSINMVPGDSGLEKSN